MHAKQADRGLAQTTDGLDFLPCPSESIESL
jgi:hypothetical protein